MEKPAKMVIKFMSERDELSCTQPGIARRYYGLANEKKLLKAITILSSAVTLADLKPHFPKAHWLEGDRHWQVGVPLADGKRLVIEPLSRTTREWREVEEVCVIEIGDYH